MSEGFVTSDPAEWVDVSVALGQKLWQHKNYPDIISDDQGKTYRYMSDSFKTVFMSEPAG